jgi:ketosteroid isomerase-like protein
MSTIPKQDADSPASSIEPLRQAWLDALKDGYVKRLANLVTDDIVVVHGTGRCVRGRERN